MVLSSEGLHLLSNVAVWRHDFETINDKNVAMWHRYYTDVINYYIMKETHREWIAMFSIQSFFEASELPYLQEQ